MANTYTQIHIHLIFVVTFRDSMITPEWKDDLYKYNITEKNHFGKSI